MEPTVLSGPLGHTQWESEQPFPLGFQTLDTDNGGVPCQSQSGQTGLDFRHQDQTSHHSEEGNVDKPVDLDKLINHLSRGDLQFEGDLSPVSQASLHKEELSYTEKIEGLDEISDCTLSWLFSPNFPDVIGKNSASKELTLTQDSPLEDSDVLGGQTELINLSVPSSPVKICERNSETNAGDPFLLVDFFSNEHPCLTPESVGELNPQGVTEEPADLSRDEQPGPPPSHSTETLSPETGDKGSFPDQVTDLLVTSSPTLQGLPESCLPHDHISTPLECFEGSVPLLDVEVPDIDSSLSLCPASPASIICTDAPLDVSTEESEVVHAEATVTENLASEQQGENDSLALHLSDETSSLTLPPAEDALIQGDFSSESVSVENVSKDLMEEEICSEATNQGNKEMALDLCLTVEEVRDEESWDLKPPEDVQNGGVSDLTAEQREEERTTDTNQLEVSDCNDVAGWTSEQAVETLSISKMVVDDSLPMVSAVSTREEDVSPLKAVFDALDQDGDGFVRIEEFMEFAAAYGADQVKDLTKFLDPSGLGVISFEDFHRGISAISNGGESAHLVYCVACKSFTQCPLFVDSQNEVTDSAYLGSESTYSECETFTDEDTGALVPPEMHEDLQLCSCCMGTLSNTDVHSYVSLRFSLNSELHNHSLVTVIGGEEEHFEDFGESNTSELLLETSVDGPEGEGDSPLTQPPDAGKRLSSKKVARRFILTKHALALQVLLLERRVAELEKESEASGEQHARLRQENLQLVHRANALEEQLKEQELYADEQLQQETRRHKEAMSKLERERGLELENMQARLQQLDEENSELRSCVPCLRANIERLEEEKRKLQDDTEGMTDRLQDETESRRKMADKLSHERHQSQKEKECTQELIEDLRKQLEHLQLYKLEAEAKRGRTPGAGLQEYQTRTREAELEQEIKRLKQDNRTLKEQNDELNGQIINLSIQGAKNLMSASFSDSLAAEINSVSRAELMEAIHKQEEINYRLQDYIDKIIVAIMESNPSILEVK
uniref:RAB11 family interacting protein 3 n=1 Tax=Stegastes partitus TaxID=144197 RepID=A0A3B4Z0M2_9TELE